jgi:hypothetical protein
VAADAEPHGCELTRRHARMRGEIVERRTAIGVELRDTRLRGVLSPRSRPSSSKERGPGGQGGDRSLVGDDVPYPRTRARGIGPAG